jgi:zinc protease
MKIADYQLENHFKVIYAKDASNPILCLQLYIGTGSAQEAPNEAGYSHLTEHLVFKSTAHFPNNSIMDRVTFLGGQINAYTEYDSTCFYITLASEFLQEGLEILAELAQYANFNEEQFEFEKKVIIEELKQYENDPEENFLEQIASSYLKENPYRFPIIGEQEIIEKAKKTDLELFYQKNYVPRNAYLVVCGNFDEQILSEQVKTYFGDWNDRPFQSQINQDEALPSQSAFFHISGAIKKDIIAFVFPDLKETHPDSYALSLGVKQFAIGKNSRLYKRLFNDEKLIDGMKVHSISGKNNGLSVLMLFPKSRTSLEKIITSTLQEWGKLLRFGLSENEVIEQKKELNFHYRYLFEYIESLAASLGTEELVGNYENFLSYPQRIDAVNKENVNQAIRTYLDASHIYLYHCSKKQTKDFSSLLPAFQIPETPSSANQKPVLEVKLANGIHVILKKVVGKPTIGIAASLPVSQLFESEQQQGINYLTSTLMLYGNQKRDYEQFLAFCNSNGISCGARHDTESTTFQIKCFKESLELGLDLLADTISKPLFPDEHFQNIRQTIISNLDRIKDYPHYYADYQWRKFIYGNHSNLMNKQGKKSSLQNIDRESIIKWHETYYSHKNLTLVIVGDFDFEQVRQYLENQFPKVNNKISKKVPVYRYSVAETHFQKTIQKLSQSHIHVGGYGCSGADVMKSTAFHVLAQIIGGETNSIFFNELREKTGYAYSADFDVRITKKIGAFQASTIVDKRNEKAAIQLIKDILSGLQKSGVTDYELQKTINYIRGNRLMDEESVLSQATTIAKLNAKGYGYQYYLDRDERLRNVTLSMLKSVAEEYFREENFYVHVLG